MHLTTEPIGISRCSAARSAGSAGEKAIVSASAGGTASTALRAV